MKIKTTNDIDKVFKSKPCSIETMEFKGYRLIENIMADASSFGANYEDALTPEQLKAKIASLLSEHGTIYTKITGVGQLQVYVGVFVKDNNSSIKSKIVGNNTLFIEYPDGTKAIRLHDTNIITEKDGKLLFDNGGYPTQTTHRRMMQFSSVEACSKNFETFINGVQIDKVGEIKGHITNI